MPWDYKTGNIPTSMKYLKPSIQKKAISIANHVLSSTGDEGKAIAIGISKAKSLYDKKSSLVKLAFIPEGAVFGALAGSYIGDNFGKNKKEKDRNSLIGAWIGGTTGAIGGAYGRRKFIEYINKKRYGYRPSAPKPKFTNNIKDFFKEHGYDYSKIKTKLEAKRVYREAARKHHPDMGGNAEKFKKLSTDWEGIENSNWFQKLAALRNNVITKNILNAIKEGDKDFIEEKYNKLKEIMERPLL
jgi:hypothetical protein